MQKRLFGILTTAAIIVAACGGATTSTAPSGAPGSEAPASEAPASEAPAEQTLTMAMDGDVTLLSNGLNDVPTSEAAAFLYNGLYEYDESLTPQPSLVEDFAEISPDGLVWTVKLKPGITFHDGGPLTSADVVQSYELAKSPNCTYNPSICVAPFLDTVEAVDDLTVKFTLKQKLATWATTYMGIFIESKTAIDASYAKYKEAAGGVTAAETAAFLEKVAAEDAAPTGTPDAEGNPTVNYAQFLAEAEALLTKGGQALPDKAIYTTDGVLDENLYVAELVIRIKALDASFTASAIDALAAAYPYLDFQRNPVGTGPFKFVEFRPGESLEYEANPDYFKGAPSIQRVFIPIIKDDIAGGQALAAGQVDWKYSLTGPTYQEIKDNADLQFVEYPDFGFFALYLNNREGTLFNDKNLRQAMSYCFDKEATADAATSGQGVAIYSEIPPASWAFPTTGLNTYTKDVAAGKALIEQSGWTLGSDGIYEKDGQKLSTIAAVRAERPDRSKWMQLVSDQVKECGIDLQYKEVDFAGILNMLDVYPHINAAAPESGKPFDAYFGGFGTTFDPDPFSLYHSSQCTTEEQPALYNYICYQSAEADALIEAGLVELDQAKRAEIYKEYAVIQSNDLPVIYAWADIAREGLRATVGTTADGGLQKDTPTWFSQVEKLTNIK